MNEKLAKALEEAYRITFLTGAGISVPSGLPQYQGNGDGKQAYEAIATELDEKIQDAKPSIGHLFIAGLFQIGKDVKVITQNIDGLHQKAGMPEDRVVEVHGSHVRGSVVAFGQDLSEDTWTKARNAICDADLLVVVGTSLTVSPVCHLPELALENKIPVWILNKSKTPLDWQIYPNIINEDLTKVLSLEYIRLARKIKEDV